MELIVDENADTQKEIETSELNKKIREIVSTLPQKQREVIEFKFYENLKNKEIAEKMKIKEDTVKEYYKIAKKKLKTKFIKNEIDLKEL
ncbi:sigma-70, region 4 [Parvimonas sp. oral taxon 393 str. F0440]|nr:sigma-70, region 4 [Parvimonas sp. oral taxon 393 str. F0440]